jgi:hypothetical protein
MSVKDMKLSQLTNLARDRCGSGRCRNTVYSEIDRRFDFARLNSRYIDDYLLGIEPPPFGIHDVWGWTDIRYVLRRFKDASHLSLIRLNWWKDPDIDFAQVC